MSWFKKKDPGAQAATPPVTFARVLAALKQMGYPLERDADSPMATCNFNGYPVRFHAAADGDLTYFTVNAAAGLVVEDKAGRNTWETAFAWANAWNENSFFGTASILGDAPADHFVIVDVSVPCGAGLSDQQLRDWLDLALTAALQACDDYNGIADDE